jgi:hypothetical protein
MKCQYLIIFLYLCTDLKLCSPEVALLFHHEEFVADLVKQLSEELADRHVKAFLHHYRWRLLALPLEEQESHLFVLLLTYFFYYSLYEISVMFRMLCVDWIPTKFWVLVRL